MYRIKLMYSFIIAVLLLNLVQAQSTEWNDPSITQVNTEPARASFMVYADTESALAYQPEKIAVLSIVERRLEIHMEPQARGSAG